MAISASVRMGAPPARVRAWFLDLEAHPERYRFATHGGFAFVRGRFGQVGAQFETRERFFGLPVRLLFELTEVGSDGFRFRLLRPSLPIQGRFALQPTPDGATTLSLEVTGLTRWGALLLSLPLIRWAVRRQIAREVAHVKASVEADAGQAVLR